MAKELQGEYLVAFATVAPDENAPDKISEAIEANCPDIVFCSFIVLNPYVILEGKKRNLTVVIRNDYWLKDVAPSVKQRAKETYHLADQIIAQTEPLRKELLDEFALDPQKVIVRENPIDREGIEEGLRNAKSPYPDSGCKHFVWVGRFDPIKRLDLLLSAFSLLHQVDNNTELYLVGKADDEQKYKQEGVHLVGFQVNPYPWIKYADCLLLTSDSEACPNIVREALFLGTKVITTRSFNPIFDNDNLLRFSDFDNYVDLSDKMLEIK